jgi:hypothetical protein
MRTRRLLPLIAAALCSAAAQPALAQQAATGTASDTADQTTRTAAVYYIGAPRRAGLPRSVTVADSAGSLVATYQPAGNDAPQSMTVSVVDSGTVLQGETATGTLTVLIFPSEREAGAAPGRHVQTGTGGRRVVGRWSLGARSGRMYSRAPRP